MQLTRKAILDIVVDAIDEVTTSLTEEENDEIADIVLRRLAEECPELVEDEEEEEEVEVENE